MNLIRDKWITVRREDNTLDVIAPWEIGSSNNNVVEIVSSRPDFRGALYQFLIGLVQTTFAPEDEDEWLSKRNVPPTCDDLKSTFEKFSDAFELSNIGAPAFMQDHKLPDDTKRFKIRSILMDAPGDKTIKDNLDLFIKRDNVHALCDACAAAALFTLQTNAPSGGKGHRTGLRGGGPLTTLILPDKQRYSLWEIIWLNILSLDENFAKIPLKPDQDVFPWLGLIPTSENDQMVAPQDVNSLQMFWGMPRRIRLGEKKDKGICSLCGEKKGVWVNYFVKNYGINYSSTWQHVLSSYRRQKEKDGSISLIALKGQLGGLSYQDWLSLTFGSSNDEISSQNVRSFLERKYFLTGGIGYPRLWCFGYDMDNMKARCWYEHTMPLIMLSDDIRQQFIEEIQKIILASTETAKILRDQVQAAWFSNPKDISGDTFFISSALWKKTENQFYQIAEKIKGALESNQATSSICNDWRSIIIAAAENLFDSFALNATDNVRNMKRIADAAKSLSLLLRSNKTKNIHILKEGA